MRGKTIASKKLGREERKEDREELGGIVFISPPCPHGRNVYDSNRPKSHTSHPLNFRRLYLVNFNFLIYLPGEGGSLLFSVTPCYPLSPKITKLTIHQLPTDQFQAASLLSQGWGW